MLSCVLIKESAALLLVYNVCTMWMQGKSDRIMDTLRSDWPSAIRANWILWVPAQFINFRFVPVHQQVLAANITALVWNVYFSWATRPKE
jgi:hypothetical protein